MQELTDELREVVRSAARLNAVLVDARDRQWQAPPAQPHGPAEGGAPVGGPPSDPTGETATDPRRLRVRRAVDEALAALADARGTVDTATRRLGDALDAWAGL